MSKQRLRPKNHIISVAIDRLRAGAGEFSRWRKGNSGKFLDLTGTDFRGADLRNVDLRATKLRGCDFSQADLQGAVLAGVNANSAIFVAANLFGANLHQTRLAFANLSDARLDDATLFGTIRDRWTIKGVDCSYCWITKDKEAHPLEPDQFAPGEFEVTYGGVRFQITFPGGLKPIDLVALPFHANAILQRFSRENLVFMGLNTVGVPVLEFRSETINPSVAAAVQSAFTEAAPSIRKEADREFTMLLKDKDSTIEH